MATSLIWAELDGVVDMTRAQDWAEDLHKSPLQNRH